MTLPPDMHARIGALADALAPELIAIRRTLHANPEIGFEEHETAALIRGRLEAAGIAHRSGLGKTGVAASVGQGNGRLVAIRGDMDCLPIQESTSPEYVSTKPGLMHACGHDAHTAIAIGVAEVLARLAPDLPGRAMVIFQPAEEGLGGARAMLDDGLFDAGTPDVILGYHNWPLLPAGTVGWHPTTAFASTDPLDIEIRGLSGHGAHPHLAVDPIVAAGHLVAALQTVVSREVAPLDAAVVTIGRIEGGTARNQIPDVVRLQGTTRAQKLEVREAMREAIGRICRGLGEAHRCQITPHFLTGVPPVVNDPEILAEVVDEARQVLGEENVVVLPQGSMGSEDFAEFSTRLPSAHLRIGSKLPGRDTMLHRSDFDLDEACIPTAVKTLVAAAIRLMA
jgi:hippurate hydrolase